jgi:serine/threonine protein kinase
MYVLVTGVVPFDGKDIAGKIEKKAINFSHRVWENKELGDVKDLIEQLTDKAHDRRYTAEEALGHRFFVNHDRHKLEIMRRSSLSLNPTVLTSLKSFKGTSHLQKAMLNLLVKTLEPS